MKLLSTALLLPLFLGSVARPLQPALANISLDKVIVEFKPDERPLDNINVTNDGNQPVRISVKTVEDKNPGQSTETESDASPDKIVVAPKSFELAAGEKRTVRIVMRQYPADLEAIYRVRFIPDQVSYEKNVVTANATNIRVGVIVSMGALITVTPKNPHPDLQFKRDGKIIHFVNAGNVTAQLQRDDFCTDDKKTCASLPGQRIYPGMKWDMNVPDNLAATAYTQTVLINGNFSKLSYPAN